MSYLNHFHLREIPFGLTPNMDFYCHTTHFQDNLDMIQYCLHSGEGFLKVLGEVGTGKTFLCRRLLDTLPSDRFVTVYVPNPHLDLMGLATTISRELGLPFSGMYQDELTANIHEKLLELHASGKQVALLLDEAQAISDQNLEYLRLLSNLETNRAKLISIVLFGQPELDERLNRYCLRQLQQRIGFAVHLGQLNFHETQYYLTSRLLSAGHPTGKVFSPRAIKLLYRSSCGVPRVLNIVANKALLIASISGKFHVNALAVRKAIKDSRDVVHTVRLAIKKQYFIWRLVAKMSFFVAVILITLIGFWYYAQGLVG